MPEGFLFGYNYRSSNLVDRSCIWQIKVPIGKRVTLEILGENLESFNIKNPDTVIYVS